MYRLFHGATFLLFLFGFALAGSTFAQGQAQPRLPTLPLSIGRHALVAEVAASPDTRERGLMFRYDLKDNEGMLFVFPAAQRQS